jgi:hypothetical protein
MDALLLPFRVLAKRTRLCRVAAGPESIPALVATQRFRQAATAPRLAIWAALIALLLGGCIREKDRLDEQVRQLCAKDGGIKIYEHVRLAADKFDERGHVNFYRRTSKEPLGAEYFFEVKVDFFRKGNPEMWRNYFQVVRRSDGKVLGESISYSRRGGDWPGPWHESSFGCPDQAGDVALLSQVFVKPN